jgi:hypothetical protein
MTYLNERDNDEIGPLHGKGYTAMARLSRQEAAVESGMGVLRTVCRALPQNPDDLELVAHGLATAITAAFEALHEFGRVAGWVADLKQVAFAFHSAVMTRNELDGVREVELQRRYSDYAEWKLLGYIGRAEAEQCRFSTVATGMLVIQSMSTRRPITQEMAKQLRTDAADISLTLTDLAYGRLTGYAADKRWLQRLARRMPDIFNVALVNSTFRVTPPTSASRMRSQLYASMHYSTPAKRAGVMSKAEFSTGELALASAAVQRWLSEGDPRGSLAILAVTAGISLELLPNVRLSAEIPENEIGAIDIPGGAQIWDFRSLVDKIAAPLAGTTCVPASLELRKPLAREVASELACRLQKYPSAQMIQELYPEVRFEELRFDEAFPKTSYPIKPASFIRKFRLSLAQSARRNGFDGLLIGAMTNDFGFACRSKIHYATIDPSEMVNAARAFFFRLDGGTPR